MTGSATGRSGQFGIRVASILLVTAPFAFALIRAFRTGNDLRYLWMALASMLGAMLALGAGKARNRTTVLAVSVVAVVVATLCAGVTARLVSAATAPVTWLVAFAFSCCSVLSRALSLLARPALRR